jgi:maltose O-acetyltransferase
MLQAKVLKSLTTFQAYAARPAFFAGRYAQRIRLSVGFLREFSLRLTGHMPTNILRVTCYRASFGVKVGKGARIGGQVLDGPQKIIIGARAVIKQGTVLDGGFPLSIGANASISIQSVILTLEHGLQASDICSVGAPVAIGDRVFTGTRAMVFPGVSIGEGVAVGAGAVVTRDVEPYAIVGAVPAKPIGFRPRQLTYQY